MIRRSRTGTELIKVGVEAAVAGAPADPTAYAVELAFMVEGTRPTDVDYHVGSWEMIRGKPYACLMVGPAGAMTLTETDEVYIPWVRIDSPGAEKPEVKGGPDDVIEVY